MNKRIILIVALALVIGLFGGCTPAAEKPLDDPNINDPYDYNNNRNNPYDPDDDMRDNRNGNGYYDNGYLNNDGFLSESRLEALCNQINGVDGCVVVVDGDSAYCGIDTNGLSNSQVNAVRQKVTNQIKESQPNIDNVYCTTDQTSYNDMRKLKNNAGNNTRSNKMLDGIKGYFQ